MPNTPDRHHARRRVLWSMVALFAIALGMSALWNWTPLGDVVTPKAIAAWLRTAADAWWMPILVIVTFVVANAVMFPNTALCLAAVLALGPTEGFAYAMGGSMLAAVITYAAGRRVGAGKVKKLEIRSLDRLAAELRRGGIVQVLIVRLLPLAPFTAVNIMAGALRVPVAPYVIGTALGLLPGILLFTVFGRQVRRLIANPTATDLAIAIAAAVVLTLGLWQARRLTTPARNR